VNEENLALLIQGMMLGLSIAAPIGPIGVLCIRRSAERGFRTGLASGLGAATADAVYGTIAAAGLTAAANFLVSFGTWMGLMGGIFLIYLGWRTIFSKPQAAKNINEGSSAAGDYVSTFLLTLSNPVTIFSFMALFGGMSAQAGFRASAFLLVAGVFLGSAAWWIFLSAGVGWLGNRLTDGTMKWINRSAGILIIGFGMALLWRTLFE